MESYPPFVLFDCGLTRFALGKYCSNLRELLEAMRTVPDPVLEHHLVRCVLDDHFELNEFPNDLARWCWEGLGDQVLAEQLGLLDPYQSGGLAAVRATIVDAVEDRLWTIERVPWCRPGRELHLVQSRVIAYDSDERFTTPAALAEAFPRISLRSLFYHVHEAHWRGDGKSDDFSSWLEVAGAKPEMVRQWRSVDFYFRNLTQLRHEYMAIFRQHLPESQAAVSG
ncbi:MAG: hypothetical protein HYS13_08420 [Planctomycetia bacterium]|nr:hypothetical protein [Planctomycetia bacterium]